MDATGFKEQISQRRLVAEEAIRVLREDLDASTGTSGILNQKIEQLLGVFSRETDDLMKLHFPELFEIQSKVNDSESDA